MSFYYDKDGFEKLLAVAAEAEAQMKRQYLQLNSGELDDVNKCPHLNVNRKDVYKGFAENAESFLALYKRVIRLNEALREYQTMLDKLPENAGAIVNSVTANFGTTFSGVYNAAQNIDYTSSKAFMLSAAEGEYPDARRRLDFRKEYNDLGKFMNTTAFKEAQVALATSKMDDWQLWAEFINGGNYSFVGDSLEGALKGMLDSLPQVNSNKNDPFEALDFFGDAYGVDDFTGWLKSIASFIDKCNKAGFPYDKIAGMPEFIEKFSFLPSSVKSQVEELFQFFLGSKLANSAFLKGLKIADKADTVFQAMWHFYQDYSVQVSYIDSMETALLNAGYWDSSLVMLKLEELREKYNSSVINAVETLHDEVVDYVKSKSVKLVGKAAPLVGNVSMGVSIISGAAKMTNYDEIKAAEALLGYSQYENALIGSYERYIKMMDDGVASQADLDQADRILELLISTKISEYKKMLAITGPFNTYYQHKLTELQELQSQLSAL